MAAILDFNVRPKYEAGARRLYKNRKMTSLGYSVHVFLLGRILPEKKKYYDYVIDQLVK